MLLDGINCLQASHNASWRQTQLHLAAMSMMRDQLSDGQAQAMAEAAAVVSDPQAEAASGQ
jgi:hypothetical protein